LISDDKELKKPTYTLKVINTSQKVGLLARERRLARSAGLAIDEDAVGGVGGFAGTKSDGIAAIDDCMRSIYEILWPDQITYNDGCVEDHIWDF
jgi:hypothetical protein